MSRYRYVPLALLAVAFLWAASLGVAQERRPDDRGKGAGTKAAKGKTFTGRVTRVDVDKGTLVLSVGTDADRDRGGRPGSGTPGTGTPERGTLDRAQKERPGAASERGDEARRDTMLTIKFGKEARITLDGKDATARDIRAGLFARVTTRAGEGDRTRPGGDRDRGKSGDRPGSGTNPGGDRPGTGAGKPGDRDRPATGGDRPGTAGGAAGDRDRAGGAEGRVLMAERIELFTKAPAERGGDRKGGDRGKDRRPGGDRPGGDR